MPFAASLSEHPITAHAVAEVAGGVLEHLGEAPDLAMLFLTEAHAGALEDAAGAVRAILSPTTLVGCAAVAVVGIAREVEEAPAVALWAARTGPVAPVLLESDAAEWPESLPFVPEALMIIGDPFSFPAAQFFDYVEARYPNLPVVGGMASAARGPGGNRLVLDDRIRTTGAVGAFLGPGVRVDAVVSQGCRPIGQPLAVTRCEQNVIYELAGAPALERLAGLLNMGLSPEDAHLVSGTALHIGLVVDEQKANFDAGDFLIRNVLGGNKEMGAVIIDEDVELGTLVQFQVRDHISADEDLRALLGSHTADAALMFPCNSRGTAMFGAPDHDATVVADAFGPIPTAGFFAAGEFGPVGGRNFLHSFTASIALLRDA